MKSNQWNKKNPRRIPVLIGPHTAGFALLGLTLAVVCFITHVQHTMYGHKMKNSESEFETLGRELQLHEGLWGIRRSHEELTRVSLALGIHMENEPRVEQFANVFTSPAGSAKPWDFRYHSGVLAAIRQGKSPFDYVKNLPPKKR